jgi:hypothetical protein
MQATVTAAPSNPFFQARWGAIVQLAVFEAVNTITEDYEPYLGIIDAPPGASADAAAIAAAHRTLVTLRPGSAAALNVLRAASLAAIPNGPAKDADLQVGEAAATAMLLLRAGDGWDAVVPYTPGTGPGVWQPTPPANAAASFTQWGGVTPFGLANGSQFRLPPPPALDSDEYADAYNEVKLVGRFDSPFRPQDRTNVAVFYAATTPVMLFNSAARQVSAAQGTTLSENARIFALLAMAIADGSIAIFDTKYHYNFWRPVTAIRASDLDPDWLPLITTPAFPGYASAWDQILYHDVRVNDLGATDLVRVQFKYRTKMSNGRDLTTSTRTGWFDKDPISNAHAPNESLHEGDWQNLQDDLAAFGCSALPNLSFSATDKPISRDAFDPRVFRRLQSEIAQLGWIAQGSLMHKAPNAWRLTRKVKAKTLTTALSQGQASLFAQAIANHRRLEELLQQMRKISQTVLFGSAPGVKKRPRQNHPKPPLT